MCKLSIIVPVFNTGRFLPRCIDSILSQTFFDFELILVDDGSTDGSKDICGCYSQKDGRVRVFLKNNGGVSSARNMGLDNALGEWVFFIDSDDSLLKNSLDLLMSRTNIDVDMVYGAIRKFDELEENLETIAVNQEGTISVNDALDAFIAPKQSPGDWQRYLGNRLYRKSIIEEFGLRFSSDIYYKEDGLFVVQYLCRCEKKIKCVADVVYLYRQTNNSAMGSLTTSYNNKLLTNVDAHGRILSELEKFGVGKELLEREKSHLFQNFNWIMGILVNTNNNSFRNRRLLKEKMIKNVGVFSYLRNLVLPRYYSKIKRFLSI